MDFSVYDYVDQPIFVLRGDAEGRPVYAFINARASAKLGKGLADVVGCAAYDIFSGRAAYALYRRQCAIWAAGVTTEYEIALPLNGKVRRLHTKLVPRLDAEGTMTHMIGTVFDISEAQDRENEITMSLAAAREMEDMVCLAAHDLRSPLGNLKSLAEVMRKDFVDHGDGKVQLIEMIDSIADKALGVVSGIMVRAIATDASDQSAIFDLGAMCDDILVLLDPMRKHSVSYPRIMVDVEYTTAHIILRNLIDNALKYATQDEARIRITVDQMNAQRLRFVVCDDGPGFSALNFANETDDHGAGFGLSAVRRLARAHGGRVMIVPPESGGGAEVQFELPGRIDTPAAKVAQSAG